jgi:hypothetical protein
MMRFLISFISCLLVSLGAIAQQKAIIKGKIVDENDKPLAGVTIHLLNKDSGTISNDSGYFTISVRANRTLALEFLHTGYKPAQRNFSLNTGEVEYITVKLQKADANDLGNVTVKGNQLRRDAGSVSIDASKALVNPSPITGIEQLIKIFVGSNNELTSQYSVRGGSYDENLMYVNDFEVFRPYLVRNGQQEGLSFINPEMTSGVKFYNGGFQSKYGDKMSSVLDITYRKPRKSGGSAYLGLLEQGFHIEGTANNGKVTYLMGARNRSNRNLLSSQDTKGNYIPNSSDLQALITYQPSDKWLLEIFGNVSQTKFTLFPEESKLSSGVFSPLYSANFSMDIYFEGSEKDKYSTNFMGLSATHMPNKNLRLKWMLSRFSNNEEENIDITGAYIFGERDFDNNSATYGLITNPLGTGVYQNFARNRLNITVWNATHKGSWDKGNHSLLWGNTIERQIVHDKLNEWEYNDSSAYSLPYTGTSLQLNKVLKSKADLYVNRFSGYIQDNIQLKDSADVIMQVGLRYNYNTLNKEFLLSPRVSMSFIPKRWKKDVVFKAAAGLYHQPPFYRELRRYDGTLNTNLKAQKSWQVSAGIDYNFRMLDRPARITTELYYKNMWDVVPYDMDNVRIRYFGENRAKAYAAGFETRLYGELVKDAESWLSIGFMRTREKIDNFYYQDYTNSKGEVITANSEDKVVADSIRRNTGYLRRPTDRLLTLGMFFQDYLSTNKNFKIYLNALYGSDLPYNIPNSIKYRNALSIDPYIRIDLGLSALLLTPDKSNRRSHSPFRNFESIWASLEIFNLIDRDNTISYLLVKDFQNNTFTMPNRLTPRLVNLKLVARW